MSVFQLLDNNVGEAKSSTCVGSENLPQQDPTMEQDALDLFMSIFGNLTPPSIGPIDDTVSGYDLHFKNREQAILLLTGALVHAVCSRGNDDEHPHETAERTLGALEERLKQAFVQDLALALAN